MAPFPARKAASHPLHLSHLDIPLLPELLLHIRTVTPRVVEAGTEEAPIFLRAKGAMLELASITSSTPLVRQPKATVALELHPSGLGLLRIHRRRSRRR